MIPQASKHSCCMARKTVVSVSVAAALAVSGAASAFEFDTDNPDFRIRWDNTVRYNLGFRAEDCDKNICGNGVGIPGVVPGGRGDVTVHQSDRKFAKAGDVVTSRLDLLSEFDYVYKEETGFRISAAGWYDDAYRNASAEGDPALLAAGLNSFPNNSQYTNSIKRWNRGPSGEFLDAFVFTKFNMGDVPVNVKLGQHNIYWGESLFSFVGGVAYGQGPVDIRKALANPGSEAKELFKPLNQFSFSSALSDRLVLAGQYFLDWKPSSLPDGGTYFGPADFFTADGGTSIPILAPAFGAPGEFNGTKAPKDKIGDWGLALKWRPEVLDGTVGFYYREYTDKLPQMVIGSFNPMTGVAGVDLDYQTPRQKMYAVSLSKQVGGISFGSDITYRKGAQINALTFAPVAPSLGVVPAGADWRPRGDVLTALANMIAYYGENSVFDSAVLMAEVNYSKLDKVTHDPFELYQGIRANCNASGTDHVATNHGCPTKEAWGMAVSFEPKWFSVLDGIDVSMPIFYGRGLHGNSPVPFGDNEGQGSWSVGLTADVQAKYNFAIKYNAFIAKHSNDSDGAGGFSNSSLGKFWDRDFLSLTFKTTF